MFEVRVTKLENENSNLIGLCSMKVDNKFAFNGMRVIKSDKAQGGFFVAMPAYQTKDGNYVDLYKPITADMNAAIKQAVARALETGGIVQIGTGETKITSFVTPVSYRNNESQVAKVNLKCGDMVCDSIAIRKSIEGNLFVGYPSYESKKLDENGNPERVSYCNPTTAEFRKVFSDDVMAKFQNAQNKAKDKEYGVKDKKETQTYTANVPDTPQQAPSR